MRGNFIGLCFVLLALIPASSVADVSTNQIRNSSFEGGVDSRFCLGRWYLSGVPSIELDSGTRVHGNFSAKIPFSFVFGKVKPVKHAGISFRSCVPIAVKAGHTYHLSAYLRSEAARHAELSITPNDPGGYSEKSLAVKPIIIGADWRRYAVSFVADKTQDVYWEINVRSSEFGHLWADALDFREGRFIADYRPAAEIEGGLTASRSDKIYSPAEPVTITLRAFNDSGGPASMQSFRVGVHDLDGKRIHDERLVMPVPGHGGIEKTLSIPVRKAGVYRAVLSSGDEVSQRESTLNFSVLPLPRDVAPRNSAFGAYLTLTPQALGTMRRVGVSWIANLTANTHVIYWSQVEKDRGKFIWYDDDIVSAKKMGYDFMFHLEPYKVPKWAETFPVNIKRANWAEYVSAMARHYSGMVKYWTVSDEAEVDERDARPVTPIDKRNLWANAAEYAEWHRAGFEAVKAADPEAKVVLNALPEFAREVLRALPAGYVDILGTNSYHIPHRVREMKALADEHGIPEVWAPGIAVISRPYYEEHLTETDRQRLEPGHWRDRVRKLAVNVIETFAYGATRLFHYTGTHVGNTDIYSLFEADSGLKPIGAQFGALIWLLDGFRSAREVSVRSIERPVRIYRFDRHDGQVVFPIYREPDVETMRIRLGKFSDQDKESVVYDHFANSITPDHTAAGLEIQTGRYPVFIMTSLSRADEVEQRLRGVSVRLDELPRAKSAQIVGRYAMLTGIEDRNLWRPPPNVSLWYRSDVLGWIELLRYRISDQAPVYTVTASGFDIEWNFHRKALPFMLEPGAFPADLVQGASYWASRPRDSAIEWDSGTVDVRSNRVVSGKTQPPSGARFRNGLNYMIRARNSLLLTLETMLEGDVTRFGGQDKSFGGWSLLVRNGSECFLHWYYAPGTSGPMRIKTKLAVIESPDKAIPLSR